LKVRGFVWLEDIVDKLETKHGVQQEEVREVFLNRPAIYRVERGHRPGEDVYAALGQTDAGRYLSIFFIRKKDNRALVVSARDMSRAERRNYERQSQ